MVTTRWGRIIPVAFVMYTIAFMDRTNISLALPSLSRDLHMTPAEAGSAAGIFFWGYLVLQVPGGYLAERWSAKRFVAILLVIWGLCATGCGLVHTWREFWLMRLLLGVAEGGVWPATLVLLAHWFPKAERARANAYWMLCLPIAVVLSSPISGWILGRWGWRAMLIAEGAVPWLWLVLWMWIIADSPSKSKWIAASERDHLNATLAREQAELGTVEKATITRALAEPSVWILVFIYFLVNCGNYGYLFWLPTALGSTRKLSHLTVGFLFAVPFAVTAVGMVWVSRHSDRKHERRRHAAGALVWAGVFLFIAVALSRTSQDLAFAMLALVGAGSYGVLGPFWAIPTETLPAGVSGPAMGVINALGNLGGYFGPVVVGVLRQRTGDFRAAFLALGAGWIFGAALTALLRKANGPRVLRPGSSG